MLHRQPIAHPLRVHDACVSRIRSCPGGSSSKRKKPATSFDVAGLAGTPVAVLAVGEPSEFCSRPSATGPKALAVRPLPGASTSPLKELAVPSRAPLKDRAGRREVIDPAHPFISAGSSGLQNAVQAAGLLH